MCRSCATLVYWEASCACRGTHTLSTSVPNVLQKHPNRPPKQSSRIRSAPTALHQGSEMLFQNQTTLCVNVSPTLRFRRISGWDLHSTAISLRSHCDLTIIQRHRFLLPDTWGVPVAGLPLHVGAFDALRAPALLPRFAASTLRVLPHRCAICTALSIYVTHQLFKIVRLQILIIPRRPSH
jgi:hypothetical protein